VQWLTWSPDGGWLTYQSDETGANEIYVRNASGRSAPIRVSTAGGECPRWRADGKSLFYRTPDGSIVEVAVNRIGNRFELSPPVVAVVGAPFANANRSFAVLDNGRHFLAFARGDPAMLTLSVGWQQNLASK
jgi:Tol biopolymer transport system component